MSKFSEDNVKSFSEEQENVNKKKKTSHDLKLFNINFLASEGEKLKKFQSLSCKH